MQIKSNFGQLQTSFLPLTDKPTNEKLRSLADSMTFLETTTVQESLEEETVQKKLDKFKEKEELEQRVDEINQKCTAFEQYLGERFQRMNDKISSIEQALAERKEIDIRLQAAAQSKRESDASISVNALSIAVQNLEAANEALRDRFENAESRVSNSQSELDKLSGRIYNRDNKFSFTTSPKEVSLEELARLFKIFREETKADRDTLWTRSNHVDDHTTRLDRVERTTKSNMHHIDKCMKKLDIRYEFLAGDDIPDSPPSTEVQAPSVDDNRTVQQKQHQQGSDKSNSGPTSASTANLQSATISNGVRTNRDDTPGTPPSSNTNRQVGGWNFFSQQTQSIEKAESDKRRAEEDKLRAEGKLLTPQFTLEEAFIQGDPKEDDDHKKGEKTVHKIGSLKAGASGLAQSKWATSPSPTSTPTPAPTKKTNSLESSKWAETPPFVPTEDKKQQSSNGNENAPATTGLEGSQKGLRRKSSSGLQSSRYAPSPAEDNDKQQQSTDKSPASTGLSESRWAHPAPAKNKDRQQQPKSRSPAPSGLGGSMWATPDPSGQASSGNKKAKSPRLSGIEGSKWASPLLKK